MMSWRTRFEDYLVEDVPAMAILEPGQHENGQSAERQKLLQSC